MTEKKYIVAQEVYCAAKINLSLDVTGKRPDGYHTLESIFQTVGVYDEITLSREQTPGIAMRCNKKSIPCDDTNLAWKAAQAILDASGKKDGIFINLKKYIPSGAGMGGGSADAAGVLYALNKMLDCGFSNEELREIGLMLGADVPFLLMGGTAYVEGIGEKMTPLTPLPELQLVIVKGRKSISTPAAYKAIDEMAAPVHPDTEGMLAAIATQNMPQLCECCGNLFEQVTECDDVFRAKQRLMECGALCAVMTGSGAAVFGIFPDSQSAAKCRSQLKKEFFYAVNCTTVNKPIEEGWSNTYILRGDEA